ncbi:CpsD/CapB family tyrosine-protein kinase [Fulvimarina endophytica]|nr:CpsD/CapB family tyrosine-protein kinase [Fulvimarina endophytica]
MSDVSRQNDRTDALASSGQAGAGERKPVDQSARLAVETGPGHGFWKAIEDMANVKMDGPMEDRSEAGTSFELPQLNAHTEGEVEIERVGVNDLAFAAREMNIKRLVLVTPFEDERSAESVLELSRRLTEDSHPVVLLDLEGHSAPGSWLDRDLHGEGWIDLLGGGREVGEIIHRDEASRLHYVPSGGLDAVALEPEQLEALDVYLEAFDEAYAMIVLHTPLAALDRIEGLNDGETAIILAAEESRQDEIADVARTLANALRTDVLHLLTDSDPRLLH